MENIIYGKQFDCILYTVVKANVYTNATEDTYQGYAYSF